MHHYWKNVKINGHSAFSAAIIAPKVSLETKRNLIKELYQLGFKPTQKDKELAYLELYERDTDTAERIKVLLMGYNDETNILHTLPLDIFKIIAKSAIGQKSLLERLGYSPRLISLMLAAAKGNNNDEDEILKWVNKKYSKNNNNNNNQ